MRIEEYIKCNSRKSETQPLKLTMQGKKILIDPWLAEKGAVPGFGGTINDHIRNPTAELPMPVSEIVDVDAVILNHDHPDHWDE